MTDPFADLDAPPDPFEEFVGPPAPKDPFSEFVGPPEPLPGVPEGYDPLTSKGVTVKAKGGTAIIGEVTLDDPWIDLSAFDKIGDAFEDVEKPGDVLPAIQTVGPAGLELLDENLGIKPIKTPKGAARKKWDKLYNDGVRRLKEQGTAIVEPFTARKAAYEKEGLKGLWKENVRRSGIPGAEAAIGILEHPEGVEGYAKDTAAQMFSADTAAEFSSRSYSENFSGLMAKQSEAIFERAGNDPVSKAGLARVGKFVGKATAGITKLATAEGAKEFEFVRQLTADDDTGKVTQGVSKMYEGVTGRRWIRGPELSRMRITDPKRFGETTRAQSPIVLSLLKNFAEIGQALGSIVVDPLKLADANTLGVMVGAQLDDTMMSLENPEKRMFEDPLMFMMDLSPAALVKMLAKAKLARAVYAGGPGVRGFGAAAQIAVGLPGPIGMLEALPGSRHLIPKNLRRGEAAGNIAASKMYDDVMGAVLRQSPMVREVIATAPDAPRSTVKATVDARQGVAGMQEQINRVSRELAESLDIGVRPLKGIPKNEAPRTPEGLAFLKYVEDLESNAEALKSFAILHDQVAKRMTEIKIEAFKSGKPPDPERVRLLQELDDPRVLMAAAGHERILKILDPDHVNKQADIRLLYTIKQIKDSKVTSAKYLKEIQKSYNNHAKDNRVLRKTRSLKEHDDAKASLREHKEKLDLVKQAIADPRLKERDSVQIQRELDNAGEFVRGSKKFNESMHSAESLKKHGAWLEIDGKPLGGVDAVMEVLAQRKRDISSEDIFAKVKVAGSEPRLMGVMSRAREIARIASWQDSRLVHHGLMGEAQAAAQFAARFNRIRDPIRAADFDPGAVALNPHARLEQGMIVQRLDYLEEVAKQLPEVTPGTLTKNPINVGGVKMPASWVDKKLMVKLPESIDKVDGISIYKYGELRGKWVSKDAAELLQVMVGRQQTFIQSLVQPFIKNQVVNNVVGSHMNAILGEALTSGMAGVDIATAWPRAAMMMKGKGTEAQRMLARHAFEEVGVFDAASVRSIDELAGTSNSFKDLWRGMTKDLKNKDIPLRHGVAGAMPSAIRLWNDKVVGWNGAKEHLWNARDKMVRLALYEDGLHKFALYRYGFTAKDLKNPKIMRKILDDTDATNFALQASVDKALDYLSLPRGPRMPIKGFGGAGIYQAAKDTGIMPFIAYPIKAGGLWTKEFFTNPAKYQFLIQGHRHNWEELETKERRRRLDAQRFGAAGWEAQVGYGLDATINTQNWQPVANIAGEFARMSKEELIPPYAAPLLEAIRGETIHGKPILNRVSYLFFKMAFDPGSQKLAGVNEAGMLDKLLKTKRGEYDPLTHMKPVPAEVWAQLFIKLTPNARRVATQKALGAAKAYRVGKKQLLSKRGKFKGNLSDEAYEIARNKLLKEFFQTTGRIDPGFDRSVGAVTGPVESR